MKDQELKRENEAKMAAETAKIIAKPDSLKRLAEQKGKSKLNPNIKFADFNLAAMGQIRDYQGVKYDELGSVKKYFGSRRKNLEYLNDEIIQ